MIIETMVLGAGVAIAAAGQRALQDHRQRRIDQQLAELQFRALLTSQEMHAKTTAARRAMVEEVRRQGGVGRMRGER